MPINGWSLRNTSKITSRGYESLAKVWVSITMIARRFPPPWSAEVTPNCFVVRDANVLPSGDRARTHNRRRRASDRLGPITFGILGAAVVPANPHLHQHSHIPGAPRKIVSCIALLKPALWLRSSNSAILPQPVAPNDHFID